MEPPWPPPPVLPLDKYRGRLSHRCPTLPLSVLVSSALCRPSQFDSHMVESVSCASSAVVLSCNPASSGVARLPITNSSLDPLNHQDPCNLNPVSPSLSGKDVSSSATTDFSQPASACLDACATLAPYSDNVGAVSSGNVIANYASDPSLAKSLSQLPEHLASFFADLPPHLVPTLTSVSSELASASCNTTASSSSFSLPSSEPPVSSSSLMDADIVIENSSNSDEHLASSSSPASCNIAGGMCPQSPCSMSLFQAQGEVPCLGPSTTSDLTVAIGSNLVENECISPVPTSDTPAAQEVIVPQLNPSPTMIVGYSPQHPEVTGVLGSAIAAGKSIDSSVYEGKTICEPAHNSPEHQTGNSEDLELEDGQIPGQWTSDEAFDADGAKKVSENYAVESAMGVLRQEETPVVSQTMDVAGDQLTMGVHRSLGHIDAKLNKNKRRQKGKGAIQRARKKSRMQKGDRDSRDVALKAGEERRQLGDFAGADESSAKKVGQIGDKSGHKKLALNKEEATKGTLSWLLEEEVGLWTTDAGDEQITSSQLDIEGGEKKIRGPMTAARKVRKKIAYRKKRAEKEREQGIIRNHMPISSKPQSVPCKYYMKGRCTQGENCTFSHDGIPITKSDPCKFLMINRCLKGDDCPFSHSLERFPCKFFHTRGHCLDGSRCRFSHQPLTEEDHAMLAKRIEQDSKERQSTKETPPADGKTAMVAADVSPQQADISPQQAYSPEYSPNWNTPPGEDYLGWGASPKGNSYLQSPLDYLRHSTSIANILFPETLQSEPLSRTPDLSTEDGASHLKSPSGEVEMCNPVLLAARKVASAATAKAAAGTSANKLLGTSTRGLHQSTLPLLRGNSFGNFSCRVGQGGATSAMELLQASLGDEAVLGSSAIGAVTTGACRVDATISSVGKEEEVEEMEVPIVPQNISVVCPQEVISKQPSAITEVLSNVSIGGGAIVGVNLEGTETADVRSFIHKPQPNMTEVNEVSSSHTALERMQKEVEEKENAPMAPSSTTDVRPSESFTECCVGTSRETGVVTKEVSCCTHVTEQAKVDAMTPKAEVTGIKVDMCPRDLQESTATGKVMAVYTRRKRLDSLLNKALTE